MKKEEIVDTFTQSILIFDFDGTIADTHQYIIDIANRMADEFKYKVIDKEDIPYFKNLTSQNLIEILNVPIMKIPAIMARGKKEFQKNISSLSPFDGLKQILYQIKEKGHLLGILSSNSLENINTFLKYHELNIFDFIHATPKLWSKNTSLKKLIQKNGFPIERILYIGDEIRDILAAKKLGIKVAAVSWGYNAPDALIKYEPNFLLKHPEELSLIC